MFLISIGLIFFLLSILMGYFFFIGLSMKLVFFGLFNIFKFCFSFDPFNWLFLSVLFSMVFSVIFFTRDYMVGEEKRLKGFVLLVLCFVLSMVFLVVSGDWLSLVLGWDWLGITSFFLVAYYSSEAGWVGSLKTYLTNRVGDGLFLFLICSLLFSFFWNVISLSYFFVFLGIILSQTKSAQLPFSAWLPAAMAAPTPVSALVHSSTLVTAGVFILMRSSVVFGEGLSFIQFIGLLTLFVGSFSACSSFDLKKVVAFSTLSHLGFMFVCFSSGFPFLAFFHLLTHACFKALLFISAGMLIVNNGHCQDFRQMGASFSNLFFVWCGVVSVLSLCGFPFLSGFFSKDFILEGFFWSWNFIFYFVFFLSIFFSVFYSIRLVWALLSVQFGPLVDKSSGSKFYLITLLFYSVVLGSGLSSYFFKFSILPSNSLMVFSVKILIFLGLFMAFFSLPSFLGSSVCFMDSLGGFSVKSFKIFSSFQKLDKGYLSLLSETWVVSYPPFIKSWEVGQSFFFYFFLYYFVFFLFW